MKIQLDTLGKNHPDTALSYHNLGIAYNNKEEYDKAIRYHEKALKVKLYTLGENHPDTAISYNNFGYTYFNKREYDKAIRRVA